MNLCSFCFRSPVMDKAKSDEHGKSAVTLDLAGDVLFLSEDEPATCLCCDGPVDSELNSLSDVVLEGEECPILGVVQVRMQTCCTR